MKSRILSIALALSMLAAVFVALPARSAIDYTGTVRTTDDDGTAKTNFIESEHVYVFVTVQYRGEPWNATLTVTLETLTGGYVDSFNVNPGQYTALGQYNSSQAATNLDTFVPLAALEENAYRVVVTAGGEDFAQAFIVIKAPGIRLEPPEQTFNGNHKTVTAYAPGQALKATVQLNAIEALSQFYVQVVNETGVALAGLNWTAQNSASGYWVKNFTLPASAADGTHYIRVRAALDNDIMYEVQFDIQKYVFEVIPQRYTFIPGMTALLDYYVINMGTLQPDTGVTVTYHAHWLNSSGNDTWMNSTLTGTTGTHSFVIPTDISLYENVEIQYYANQSTRSDDDFVTLNLERVAAAVAVGDAYSPGDTVIVSAGVYIGWQGIEGATVNVKVTHNGTELPAYGATNLVTGLYGMVSYAFVLAAGAAEGSYIVAATATWMTDTAKAEDRFTVSVSGSLDAMFDKDSYFSGETATVNLKAVWSQQEVDIPVVSYRVTINTGLLTLGNTTDMVITVDIPSDYFGFIGISVAGVYNGHMLTASDLAQVYNVFIDLVTSATEYRPGDVIEFSWLIVGGPDSGNLTYEITDNDGVRVQSGQLTPFEKEGSFELEVPEIRPSTSYEATIIADLDGIVIGASEDVDIVADDYQLLIWVAKSPYADGSYKPGQTVKIHYSIESFMLSQQNAYRIDVYIDGSMNPTFSALVTEPTGDLEYKIPKEMAVTFVDVDADLYGVDGLFLDGASTSFMVSNAESGWDRSIGGMAAIDFVLLVLLIIVIVMLILVPWLKGRMGAPKPPEPAPPAESGKLPPP